MGTSACYRCQAGQFSDPPSNGCNTCPDGWAQSSVGASACYQCKKNEYSDPPSTGCKTCPSGWVSQYYDGGGADCALCPTGAYINNAGDCKECPHGYYQSQNGQYSCKSCGSPMSGYSFVSRFENSVEEEACDQVKLCPAPDTDGLPHCYEERMAGACSKYDSSADGHQCRRCCWERAGTAYSKSCNWHAKEWGGETVPGSTWRGFDTLTGMKSNDMGIIWCSPVDAGF